MANRIVLNETSYHGKGAVQDIVTEVKKRCFKKALVVTDPDLIKFHVADNVTKLLDANGLAYEVYDKVKANPTVNVVKGGVEMFKSIGANYVITDEEKRRKFVCADCHDIPVVAIIDPDMMSSMPKGLTAATGMDALTHAIEGYITKGAWELTDMMHLKAIEIIARSLRAAVENDPKGREDMALGQYVAGMGFSNVGLGIVHSMAHPLGAFYDTPHGVANAVILPYVMEYNAPCTGEKYRDIAKAMGVQGTEAMSQEEYRKAAIDAVKKLSEDVGIPKTLHEIGVKEEDLKALSEFAFIDACTPGNPRDTSPEEIFELYKKIY